MPQSTPHPIDVHVGAAIRVFRRRLNMSQTAAAEALGVSFQQLQKYEKGTNRVSASKLYELAQKLGVPIEAFFEGLAGSPRSPKNGFVIERMAFLATQRGGRLIERAMGLDDEALDIAIALVGWLRNIQETRRGKR